MNFTAQQMPDLTIKPLSDGNFELEQQWGGCDDPVVIQVHPLHARLLAEMAGVTQPTDPTLKDRLTERHTRRIKGLDARLEELLNTYLDDIIDRCGSGIEISLHLRAIRGLVDDLLADVGGHDSEMPAKGPAAAEGAS
jgi:hypothetical protein